MIRRILAGALALLIVLGGGLFLYLRSALPQIEGRVVLPGPKAEIRIDRDADGVPLITAQDDEDVAFGLGFVHAQERLFQMDFSAFMALGGWQKSSGRRRSRSTARCECSAFIAAQKPKYRSYPLR